MLTNNASTLALGVLLFSSFGCSGSEVSLGNNGQSGNAGSDPAAGGAVAEAGAPGSAGTPSAGGAGSASGATNAGGATNTAGAPGSAGAPSRDACRDPVALGGGWERCNNGFVHRPTPGKCEYTPRAAAIPATGAADECAKDSQCTAKPYGYCALVNGGNTATPTANRCLYGCVTDAECDAGNVCQCAIGASAGVCGHNPPSCKSDADCTGGALCTNYQSIPGCMSESFACQTPADECAGDFDCPRTSFSKADPVCTFRATHRVCAESTCVL